MFGGVEVSMRHTCVSVSVPSTASICETVALSPFEWVNKKMLCVLMFRDGAGVFVGA